MNASNMDMLLTACEQFLGKPDSEIRSIARETLEGHQRAMMGNMTVEVCLSVCLCISSLLFYYWPVIELISCCYIYIVLLLAIYCIVISYILYCC